MKEHDLKILVDKFKIQEAETECIEFKEAKNGFDLRKIGKYFSALSNEANLKGEKYSWLIFGMKDKPLPREIVGSSFRTNRADLDSLKGEIAQHTTNGITFNEIYEYNSEEKRLVLFQIPAAPLGIPIAWQGHYYGRNGEETSPLSLVELETIRNQANNEDWSAKIIKDASIEDLDKKAIKRAKENYKVKFPKLSEEVDEWDTITFLNKAKMTINGNITNTAIILLGKSEAEHYLSPAKSTISWIVKDKDNVELDWEHFHPPFLLEVDEVFNKIRNLKYRYFSSDSSLFPNETTKYDPFVIREALHNCIAHQDYTMAGRIFLVELPNRLLFKNSGSFIPESVFEVITRDAPNTKGRNGFLTEAMFNLNMIDTIGSGIKRMFRLQKERFFPLPEYSIKDDDVTVEIYGEVINQNYTQFLAEHKDFTLGEAIILDKAQKGKFLNEEEQQFVDKLNIQFNDQVNDQVDDQVDDQVEKELNRRLRKGIFITSEMVEALSKVLSSSMKPELDKKVIEKYKPLLNYITKEQKIVLEYCLEPKSSKKIQEDALGLKKHTTNFRNHIEPLLTNNLLHRTIPNSPTSKLQKYRTTKGGRAILHLVKESDKDA